MITLMLRYRFLKGGKLGLYRLGYVALIIQPNGRKYNIISIFTIDKGEKNRYNMENKRKGVCYGTV